VSVLPPIEEEFVSTGQVKVQMWTVAILGEESELAAQAAECANDQGRFWDFHDVLYANQEGENRGAFSSENLKRFAGALALDTAAFDSCLDSGKYASKVRDDTEAARQQGVNKTPTILVNGKEVTSSLDDVRAAIQEELASGS
jgi:protein-disulfide isomerase